MAVEDEAGAGTFGADEVRDDVGRVWIWGDGFGCDIIIAEVSGYEFCRLSSIAWWIWRGGSCEGSEEINVRLLVF